MMKGSKLLFVASWVILLILSVLVALTSLGSFSVAYTDQPDQLTANYSLEQIKEQGGDEAVQVFRGRRATAASWALGYALLAFCIILLPYRRGERWAWWALLISLGLPQLLSLARVVMIGTSVGAGVSGIVLAFLLLGLLAGVPRMFSRRDEVVEI